METAPKPLLVISGNLSDPLYVLWDLRLFLLVPSWGPIFWMKPSCQSAPLEGVAVGASCAARLAKIGDVHCPGKGAGCVDLVGLSRREKYINKE